MHHPSCVKVGDALCQVAHDAQSLLHVELAKHFCAGAGGAAASVLVSIRESPVPPRLPQYRHETNERSKGFARWHGPQRACCRAHGGTLVLVCGAKLMENNATQSVPSVLWTTRTPQPAPSRCASSRLTSTGSGTMKCTEQPRSTFVTSTPLRRRRDIRNTSSHSLAGGAGGFGVRPTALCDMLSGVRPTALCDILFTDSEAVAPHVLSKARWLT